MIEIASLVGPSYAGKSTLAEGLQSRLASRGVTADIIKKDHALQAVGRERYGDDDTSGGYSIVNALMGGKIPSSELHAWMNERVRASRELGNLVILEGGTRTRRAQAETLDGLEDAELGIFMLQLPFKEVLSRARQRRAELHRYDDMLPVAAAKLVGQYFGSRSSDAVRIGDPDVIALDAMLPPEELVTVTADHILTADTAV